MNESDIRLTSKLSNVNNYPNNNIIESNKDYEKFNQSLKISESLTQSKIDSKLSKSILESDD